MFWALDIVQIIVFDDQVIHSSSSELCDKICYIVCRGGTKVTNHVHFSHNLC